jgi:hypothetical protein
MSRSAKEAAKRVAKVRGCSYGEARKYCEEVQDIFDDSCPSFAAVADALEKAVRKSVKSSDEINKRHISKRASVIHKSRVKNRNKGPEKNEKNTEDDGKADGDGAESRGISGRNPEVFDSSLGNGGKKQYKAWLGENKSGYVLNMGSTPPMLHAASCDDIKLSRDESTEKPISNAKVCSRSKSKLKRHALRRSGSQLQRCQHCDPQ